MSRSRARAAAIAFAVAALTVSIALPSTAAANADTAMVKAINAARTSHGLPRVRFSRAISSTSQAYARTLARHSLFQHARNISAPGFRRVAEILGLAWGTSGRTGLVRSWLNSPVHREILLSRAYRYVGLGVAKGRMGDHTGARYWVVRFGSH